MIILTLLKYEILPTSFSNIMAVFVNCGLGTGSNEQFTSQIINCNHGDMVIQKGTATVVIREDITSHSLKSSILCYYVYLTIKMTRRS